MKEKSLKLKKGGLDTIIAYIVVMLPLLYVLVYMIATIYHFSVQMYMNQVVKEAAVMISTYGTVTSQHTGYITDKLSGVLNDTVEVSYYIRSFNATNSTASDGALPGVVGPVKGPYTEATVDAIIKKADLIGIYVQSTNPSILANVSDFSFFGGGGGTTDKLHYSSYREEIIRNERP